MWAEGQLCWFRHSEQRGLTGKQICCPKPTSSQFISLHKSLIRKKCYFFVSVFEVSKLIKLYRLVFSLHITLATTPPGPSLFLPGSWMCFEASQVYYRCDAHVCPHLNQRQLAMPYQDKQTLRACRCLFQTCYYYYYCNY